MIKYHFVIGNNPFVTEQLDKVLADFGLVFGNVDYDKYERIVFPVKYVWGAYAKKFRPCKK